MQNVNKLISQLDKISGEADNTIIQNGIANILKEMGYNAISEEIKNNRRAKDNALYGLKMYYGSLIGDRINPVTSEVFPASETLKERAASFYMIMKDIIYKFLDNGTDNQQEYQKLINNYSNEYYKMNDSFHQLDNHEITTNTDDDKEYERLYNAYKEQCGKVDYAKNKLDQFVFNNIG